MKFIQLLQHHNPNISSFTEVTIFEKQNPLELNDINFKVAFKFSSFYDLLDDPSKYRTIILYEGWNPEEGFIEKYLSYHKCTQEDLDKFYPLSESYEENFRIAQDSGGFQCIDIDDDEDLHKIYGSWEN